MTVRSWSVGSNPLFDRTGDAIGGCGKIVGCDPCSSTIIFSSSSLHVRHSNSQKVYSILHSSPSALVAHEYDPFASTRLAAVSPRARFDVIRLSNTYLRRAKQVSDPLCVQDLPRTTLQRSYVRSSTTPSEVHASEACFPSSTFVINGGAAPSAIRPCGLQFISATSPLRFST